MTSLLDVANIAKPVPLSSGASLVVAGVSALGIAHLMAKFPELRDMLGGRKQTITPERLFEAAPAAVAAIIAAGVGHPGEPDYEKAAAGLPLGDQLDLILAIWEATAPNGLGPFLDKVAQLFAASGNTALAASIKAAGTK